MSGCFNNTKR